MTQCNMQQINLTALYEDGCQSSQKSTAEILAPSNTLFLPSYTAGLHSKKKKTKVKKKKKKPTKVSTKEIEHCNNEQQEKTRNVLS